MCDIDFDSDCELDVDSDFDEGVDFTSDFDFSENLDSIDLNDDIEGFDSEYEEESTEEYPSLEEYDAMIDEADSIDELNNMREALECGMYVDENIEPEMTIPLEYYNELKENNTNNPEFLSQLEDLRTSGRLAIDTEEFPDEDGDQKVLTRKDEMDIGGIETDDYNLESPTSFEREFVYIDENLLESEEMASELEEADSEEPFGLAEIPYIDETEEENLNDEFQEMNIDYDEIYESIQQEQLEQGFKDIDIYTDSERLDSSLENFKEDNWEELSLDNQKGAMADLAEYVEEVIGFENPPRIEYYNNPKEGDFGGYNESTNTLHINEYMLYNSNEAADTIAHELWHAHQYECATAPQSARDYQYQYNFENYIKPEMGHEAYESQLIEAEARAFAAQFRERLAENATKAS